MHKVSDLKLVVFLMLSLFLIKAVYMLKVFKICLHFLTMFFLFL